MPSLFFVAFLAIASLQGTFGAPCKDLGSCISKCKAKTGLANPIGNHTYGSPSSVPSLSSGSTPAAKLEEPAPTSTPTTQPAPASTPASSTPASDGSSSDIADYLNAHNTERAKYGANNLSWNDTLAKAAQQWANGCVFKHSQGELGPYGENLAAGTGTFTIDDAIGLWNDESSQYNPNNPTYSHWTQVVWKSTTSVGCALQNCSDGTVLAAGDGIGHYYVCEYFPAGNVEGEFAQNVQ